MSKNIENANPRVFRNRRLYANFISYLDEKDRTEDSTPSAIAYGVQSLFASLTTGAYGFGSLQTCNHKFVFVLFFI